MSASALETNGRAPGKVTVDDAREISSIVGYIRRAHGFEVLQPWLEVNLRTDSVLHYSRYIAEESVLVTMGVPYYVEWQSTDRGSLYLSAKPGIEQDISSYDYALFDARFAPPEAVARQHGALRYQANPALDSFRFWIVRDSVSSDTAVVSIRPMIDSLLTGEVIGKQNEIPPERMIVEHGGDSDFRVKICFRTLYIERHEGADSVKSCSATILYSETGDGNK